jgi:hypothetical protein
VQSWIEWDQDFHDLKPGHDGADWKIELKDRVVFDLNAGMMLA